MKKLMNPKILKKHLIHKNRFNLTLMKCRVKIRLKRSNKPINKIKNKNLENSNIETE
jgi:hypothetical protein